MRKLLLVLFFLMLPLAKVFAGECNTTASELRSLNKSILEGHKERDQSYNIFRSINTMKDCNFSSRESGMGKKQLMSLLRATQRSELARIQMDLEDYAATGRIEDFANEYRSYARDMGLREENIERYLAQQKSIAEKSYAREKVTCTAVDMSEDFGPVRDQDSMGWCYAFSVADIASYKLKKRISAADIALTYNKDFFNDILKFSGKTAEKFEGGIEKPALMGAIEKGLCLEKDFPSEDNAYGGLRNQLDQIDTLGRKQIRSEQYNCNELCSISKSLFPNVTPEDLQKILETSSRQDFMDKMADKSCKNRIKTDMKVESPITLKRETLGKVIDEQLGAKNPIALGYNASGLYDRRNYSRSGHASVLVGRRFNEKSGQCEYLLRNSWGRNCGYYDKAYECDQGNIWIPKADIIKRGSSATYIK